MSLTRRIFLRAAGAALGGALALGAPAAMAADDTIKIGILHSLSGTMAISETTLKDAMLMLIAEQNIGFLEVATRVFVLEGGRIRFSGTVAEMTDNEALRRAYFGLK